MYRSLPSCHTQNPRAGAIEALPDSMSLPHLFLLYSEKESRSLLPVASMRTLTKPSMIGDAVDLVIFSWFYGSKVFVVSSDGCTQLLSRREPGSIISVMVSHSGWVLYI